ncbi:MAG: tetratricopeptide repeat protein [Planctomycetota bacterium]
MAAGSGGSASNSGALDALRAAAGRGWPLVTLAGGAALVAGGLAVSIMTAPEPDYSPGLRDAAVLVQDERYDEAIDTLNQRVAPYLALDDFADELRRAYYLLAARALYGANLDLPARQVANDQNVANLYRSAARLEGGPLSDEDLWRFADSLAEADEFGEALDQRQRVSDEGDEIRARIAQRVVEAELDTRLPRFDRVVATIEGVLGNETVRPADRVWLITKRAEVRRRQEKYEISLNEMLREMPRLIGDGAPGLAGLHLELGRAYLAVGDAEAAAKELDRVLGSTKVPESDPIRGLAEVYRGRAERVLALDDEGLEEARRRFAGVIDRRGDTDALLPALLSMAAVEIELGNPEGATVAFDRLVDELRSRIGVVLDPTTEEITAGMLDAFEMQRSRGDSESALGFALDATALYDGIDETPPNVLEAAAIGHRERAFDLLGMDPDESLPAELWKLVDLESIDLKTEYDVKRHLIQSAAFFRSHADRFVIDDLDRYADSLWSAARLFDQAGDKEAAIAAYTEFLEALPSETRRAEAMFRVAQSFQSLGDYQTAATRYREIRILASEGGQTAVGDWPQRSIVPLAQALMFDADPENDGEAEDLLRQALSGAAGGPDRPEFAEALLQLGRVLHRTERFNESIERLTEMLERFPEHEEASIARYTLADSHRRLAGEIRERLTSASRESEARLLSDEREGHLTKAMTLFEQVRADLGEKSEARLGELEMIALRNSYFYLGDCAYDLGDPDTAIAHYSAARTAYPGDPAVLVALIQVVNAFLDKGEIQSARTAHERAKDFFKSLPEEVWDDPNLPLTREDWQRWLDSSSKLYEQLQARGG